MCNNNIADISYVRISTSSVDQLTSISNQLKILKTNPNYGKIIIHSGSGGKELCAELHDEILKQKENGYIVRVNIVSFDRLTRNFKDLDFLYKNVKYINVLDEKKIYDFAIDLAIISGKITNAIQELDSIKSRHHRLNTVENNKIEKTNNTDETKIRSRKRKYRTSDNLTEYGIDKDFIINLEEFINISQNIKNKQDWLKLCELEKDFDTDCNIVRKLYRIHENEYNKKNKKEVQMYYIKKHEVMYIIINALNKIYKQTNSYIIRNFVNAHYYYAHNYDNVEDNKNNNELDQYKVNNILNGLFNKIEMDLQDRKQLESLINKYDNVKKK